MAKLQDFSKFHLLEVTPNVHLFTHMVPPVQGRPKVELKFNILQTQRDLWPLVVKNMCSAQK